MIGWSAHLGTLFPELPLLDRFTAASEAGFTSVDLWSPFDSSPAQIVTTAMAAGVTVTVFNLDVGDMKAGDRGYLNDPSRRADVLANASEAVALARELGCRQINALAGNVLPNQTRVRAVAETCETLRAIVAIAEPHQIEVLVEPLNEPENPRYLIRSASEAVELIRAIGSDSVGLLYDAYHAGMAGLSAEGGVITFAPSIRHVHVADWPGRHQPGTGNLDLRALVAALDSIGYSGHIGLEFIPTGGTIESLEWLPDPQRREDARFLLPVGGALERE